MSKIKVLIQIFPLIKDIDLLERTLVLLRQNCSFIDKNKYHVALDVTLPIGNYLTDWENSKIKQEYFIDKFLSYKKYGDWCSECNFNVDDSVKGILDCFLNNMRKYEDFSDIILLETDVIFNQYTLNLLLNSSQEVKKLKKEYIITPQYTKLWDDSWDVVVNSKFINKPQNYRDIGDPIEDVFMYESDVNLLELQFNNNKFFKFGGGWFTLYSKALIDAIKFPESLQGYGALDNFISIYCNVTQRASQYVIKNLVVTEDCKYTKHSPYKDYVSFINRRDDLYQKNNDIMAEHFKNLFTL